MREMITISQKQFFDYADSIEVYESVKDKNGELKEKRVLLDMVDFSLFDYLFYVYNADWVKKLETNDGIYAWLSYKKIIDDNPQLRINNKKAIAKRLKKLEKFGLIKTFVYEKKGNKTYFKITSDVYKYFNRKPIKKTSKNKLNDDNLNNNKNKDGSNDEVGVNKNYQRIVNEDCQWVVNEKCNSKYIRNNNLYKKDNNINETSFKNDLTIEDIISTINDYLLSNDIILSTNDNFQLKKSILELNKLYPLNELLEVINFAKKHKFYYKLLANPKSLENNFNSIKLEYQKLKEKEKEEQDRIDKFGEFYSLRGGYVI